MLKISLRGNLNFIFLLKAKNELIMLKVFSNTQASS